ncbi:MAG: GAF domain-containing sensor histidine kinase [Anaerolineae bacterium]
MTVAQDRLLALEWLLAKLRWVLVALIFLILLLDPLSRVDLRLAGLILLVAVLYSGLVMILLRRHLFVQDLPVTTSVIDVLLIMSFVLVSGRARSPLLLFSVLPITTAALRLGVRGGLMAASAFGLFYEVLLVWQGDFGLETLFQAGSVIILFLLVALLSALLRTRERDLAVKAEREATQRLEHAQYHISVLYEATDTLTTTLSYQRVLETMLEVSDMSLRERGQPGTRVVGLVLLFEQEGKDRGLYVVASRHLDAADKARTIAGKEGAVWQVVSSAEPVVVTDLGKDPELGQFTSLQRCRSALCVPLRAGFEIYGVAVFAGAEESAYLEERLDFLTAFCNQAAMALQNAQLYHSLRQERDRIIDSGEAARKELARELHDGPTQAVASIAMRLNFAKLLLGREPDKAKEELEDLESLAHQTARQIRTTLFKLRPLALETGGLAAALEQYASRLQEDRAPEVHLLLETGGFKDRLSSSAEGVVFSIVQEAVSNALKHAQAANIWVEASAEGDWFVAKVRDDGRGFDLAEVEESYDERTSLGLLNMRERAELVDGTLTIDSAPGRGTTVTAVVPFQKDSDEGLD